MVFHQQGGEDVDLPHMRSDRLREHTRESPAEDATKGLEGIRCDRATPAAVTTQHPALDRIKRNNRVVLAARHACLKLRHHALVIEQLQKKRSDDQRRIALIERAQAPDQHDVQFRIGFAILRNLVDRFEQCLRASEPVRI